MRYSLSACIAQRADGIHPIKVICKNSQMIPLNWRLMVKKRINGRKIARNNFIVFVYNNDFLDEYE